MPNPNRSKNPIIKYKSPYSKIWETTAFKSQKEFEKKMFQEPPGFKKSNERPEKPSLKILSITWKF